MVDRRVLIIGNMYFSSRLLLDDTPECPGRVGLQEGGTGRAVRAEPFGLVAPGVTLLAARPVLAWCGERRPVSLEGTTVWPGPGVCCSRASSGSWLKPVALVAADLQAGVCGFAAKARGNLTGASEQQDHPGRFLCAGRAGPSSARRDRRFRPDSRNQDAPRFRLTRDEISVSEATSGAGGGKGGALAPPLVSGEEDPNARGRGERHRYSRGEP